MKSGLKITSEVILWDIQIEPQYSTAWVAEIYFLSLHLRSKKLWLELIKDYDS